MTPSFRRAEFEMPVRPCWWAGGLVGWWAGQMERGLEPQQSLRPQGGSKHLVE